MGIEPSSTSLFGFQGSRGSRRIKKRSPTNCSLFLIHTLISKDEKETFSSKVGIEPSSTPFLGFQSSRGPRKIKNVHLAGLSGRIGECCTAPLHVRAKEVEALAPRLELGTPTEKASANLDGGAIFV